MAEGDRGAFDRFAERSRNRVRCLHCGISPARTFPIVNEQLTNAFCSETCALAWALAHARLHYHWCKPVLAWRPGPLFCSDCAPSPAPEEGGPD